MRVWGEDPLLCPCCKGLMKVAGTFLRPEEVEFFLRLHGLWEPIIDIPPPLDPPYDIETMESIPPPSACGHRAAEWRSPDLALDDERILVFDAEEAPTYV